MDEVSLRSPAEIEEIEETPKQEETPYQKHPQQKPCAVVAGYF